MRVGFAGMFLNEGEKENKRRGGGQRQDTEHVCGGEKQEKRKKNERMNENEMKERKII